MSAVVLPPLDGTNSPPKVLGNQRFLVSRRPKPVLENDVRIKQLGAGF